MKTTASFASSATMGGAHKHAWTKNFLTLLGVYLPGRTYLEIVSMYDVLEPNRTSHSIGSISCFWPASFLTFDQPASRLSPNKIAYIYQAYLEIVYNSNLGWNYWAHYLQIRWQDVVLALIFGWHPKFGQKISIHNFNLICRNHLPNINWEQF